MKSGLKILVLPGDGIGGEVVGAGMEILETVCRRHNIALEAEHGRIGGESYDIHGTFCLDRIVTSAKSADAVFVGAVGGPKWDNLDIAGTAEERDGLMRLRKSLDTYIGIRPSRAYDPLLPKTPFRPEIVSGSDILVLREMCGGCFFREPKGIKTLKDGRREGFDNNLYISSEIERFARAGFELAKRRGGKVSSLDKSNVMDSGVLWRQCVTRIGRDEYPDVDLEHYYADNGFYQMMCRPSTFDVVLGDNLFGDLGSDIAATVAGSLGMLPSACLPGISGDGLSTGPGIYEPVHGSAPDIAGRGIANPVGAILSVSMIFQYALGRNDLCRKIENAVQACIKAGVVTPDLNGSHSTEDVTGEIIRRL